MKRGFTLIELVVVLGLLGLLLGVIVPLLYQFQVIPRRGESRLELLSGLKETQRQLLLDAQEASFILPALPPYYLHFFLPDYSQQTISRISYYFEAGALWREGESRRLLLKNILRYEDISFSREPQFIQLDFKLTIPAPPQEIHRQATIYLTTRQQPLINYVVLSAKNIEWLANYSQITGDVHADGNIHLAGQGNEFYHLVEAYNIVRAEDDKLAYKVENTLLIGSLPVYDPSALTPTFFWDGDVELSKESEVWEDELRTKLKPGVYRATGRLTLKQDKVQGKVTLVANEVDIKVNGADLSPYLNNFLVYATKKAKMAGADGEFAGVVYVPQGRIIVSGDNLKIRGSLIGDKVTVEGKGLKLKG